MTKVGRKRIIDDDKVLQLFNGGKNLAEIAKQLGHTSGGIHMALKRQGINPTEELKRRRRQRTEKPCGLCKQTKPLKVFTKDRNSFDGTSPYCVPCTSKRNRKRKYGLSPAEQDALLAKGCGICGSTDKLCIDHDHTTGAVREALCARCNTLLAGVEDTKFKQVAESYLKRHNPGT